MKFSDLNLTTPYLELDSLFFDIVEPTPLKNPFLISTNQKAAELLGISKNLLDDESLVEILNGTKSLNGSKHFAMCYAGHQFGFFVERLGDGRAINLGKVNGVNLQVKGSGRTLYSRHGDGRAVLRSSIREYLMSEAMHGLGIETSRALAIIGSDTKVIRQEWEKGAIVLRLSPTWVRFGTFEYFHYEKEYAMVQKLADYVIDESFRDLKDKPECYLKMYEQIVKNTASTVAKWQAVGFNHGVMNTDNMSIDGRTIDYGPYAFLDDYDAEYICNHTDRKGRYSFKNQPNIAIWNLERLADALSSIIRPESSQKILKETFMKIYEDTYLNLMYKKIGLFNHDNNDKEYINTLLDALQNAKIDYTLFFRKLSLYNGDKNPLIDIATYPVALAKWLNSYDEKLKKETLSQKKREDNMLKINPKYILKNHIIQDAIEHAQAGDFSRVEELLFLAHNPFDEHHDLKHLCTTAPPNIKNIKLSCSS